MAFPAPACTASSTTRAQDGDHRPRRRRRRRRRSDPTCPWAAPSGGPGAARTQIPRTAWASRWRRGGRGGPASLRSGWRSWSPQRPEGGRQRLTLLLSRWTHACTEETVHSWRSSAFIILASLFGSLHAATSTGLLSFWVGAASAGLLPSTQQILCFSPRKYFTFFPSPTFQLKQWPFS